MTGLLYQCTESCTSTGIGVHWYRTDTSMVNYLSCFQMTFGKINVKSLKNCEKLYVNQERSVSVYTDTNGPIAL